jgi:NhaC family Na+:H+ antiporter
MHGNKDVAEKRKEIKLGIAFIPVVFLVIALSVTIGIFKLSPHIPLIAAAAVAASVAIIHKHPWKEIQDGMVHGITLSVE